VLGPQCSAVLARSDPFDVAQGVERYIRSQHAVQLRALLSAARANLSGWYASEFLPLLDETDDERFKSSFAHSLKSNLRAIPLFGAHFCEGVIAHIPGDRTIGLGEEGYRLPRFRFGAIAVVAAVAFIGAAAAEHVISNARTNAQVPVVLASIAPAPAPVPPPAKAQHFTTRAHRTSMRERARTISRPAPVRRIAQAAPIVRVPERSEAPPPVAPAPRQRVRRAPALPQAGSGVKTIVATAPTARPSPQAPENLSDMPQSYSDATPLPRSAPVAPAQLAGAPLRVPTPTPGPNRFFLHHTLGTAGQMLMHLNPFRVSRPAPKPSPSPHGSQHS